MTVYHGSLARRSQRPRSVRMSLGSFVPEGRSDITLLDGGNARTLVVAHFEAPMSDQRFDVSHDVRNVDPLDAEVVATGSVLAAIVAGPAGKIGAAPERDDVGCVHQRLGRDSRP